MSVEEDEEFRRFRERLLDGWPGARADGTDVAAAWVAEQTVRRDDELESGLRALGLSRRERERWRKRGSNRRPRDSDRDRAVALKRLAYYIDERVDWTETSADREEVIGAWAHLSNHNVDRAIEWWSKGVQPLDFAEVMKLVESGYRHTDLFTEVSGKTIVQHLKEGQPLRWCLMALDWQASAWPSHVSRCRADRRA